LIATFVVKKYRYFVINIIKFIKILPSLFCCCVRQLVSNGSILNRFFHKTLPSFRDNNNIEVQRIIVIYKIILIYWFSIIFHKFFVLEFSVSTTRSSLFIRTVFNCSKTCCVETTYDAWTQKAMKFIKIKTKIINQYINPLSGHLATTRSCKGKQPRWKHCVKRSTG